MKIPFENFQTESSQQRFDIQQQHIVEQILASDKKVIMLSAPTGTGKSIIGMMAGHQMADKVNYVCSDKALQHQLLVDFPESKMLMGRNNYTCNLFPHLQADSCLAKCEEYKTSRTPCDYYDMKRIVLASDYRILNTYYYLNEIAYAKAFSKQDVVIIDEADTLDNILINFIGLNISKGQSMKYNLNYPEKVTKLESWIDWAQISIDTLKESYDKENASHGLDQEYVKASRLTQNLEQFLNLVQDDWIYNHDNGKSEFKPVWLTPEVTQEYLWQHAKKFVLMSATLPKKAILAETLGLDVSDVDYIEVDSPFEVKNRLVQYRPTVDMSFKNKDQHYLVLDEIKAILDENPDVKGIIHSVSYSLASDIMDIGDPRLMTHTSDDRQDVLESFLASPEPLVLVSPSLERGINLVGELGRFAIFPKVPYKNLKDKQTSARLFGSGKRGGRWYQSEAAQSICQGAGRIVRNQEDYGTTYILDSQFSKILGQREQDRGLPNWFVDAIVVGKQEVW